MKGLRYIDEKILSKFSRGYGTNIIEHYLIVKNSELYVVAVVEMYSLTTYTSFQLQYALYSISNDKYIKINTKEYNELTQDFPELNIEMLKTDDEKYNTRFFEKHKLIFFTYITIKMKHMELMLSKILLHATQKKKLDGFLKFKYKKYLRKMRRMAVPGIKPIYKYFLYM